MKKKKGSNYTSDQLAFLERGFREMQIPELTKAFNAQFALEKTEGQVRSTLKNHKFTCGRPTGAKGRYTLVTKEQSQFIQDNYKGRHLVDLLELFNGRFGTSLKLSQLRSFTKNHHVKSGLTGHFREGMTAWNAGTRGLMKANRTSFRKGQIPFNIRPVGAERVSNQGGHLLMKVEERNPYTGAPTRFKHKHVVLWEEHHGPVPEGMFVRFRDGDTSNCTIENLMLVSRQEHLHLNRKGYRKFPNELKPTVLALSKLEVKVFGLQRR